ncbi:MAG: ribosome silencing factor [Bacteroidales bacterium]
MKDKGLLMKKKSEEKEDKLLEIIIETIKNKKGKEIVSINLKEIEHSVCEYFVICHADSTTQVGAIAEEVKQKTKELANIPADHIEGISNSQWVLMDYINIVVHIFLGEYRNYYHLEELWADGELTKHDD